MGVTLDEDDDDPKIVERMLAKAELDVELDEDEKVLLQVPVLLTVMLVQLAKFTTFQPE